MYIVGVYSRFTMENLSVNLHMEIANYCQPMLGELIQETTGNFMEFKNNCCKTSTSTTESSALKFVMICITIYVFFVFLKLRNRNISRTYQHLLNVKPV